MAAPSVTAQNTRIDASDGSSSASNIGGGSGSGGEPDILYQGSGGTPADRSRKVGTSASGFALTPSGVDTSSGTGTYQTLIVKYAAANFAALENLSVPGIELRLGSSSSAYALYDVQGVDTYPAKGGFILQAIDLNITGYRTSTSGSPALTNSSYFGIVGDFTATSKSENLVMSAVDVGDGLTLIGGDGASDDAQWSDFSDFDAGTLANRYGYFTPLEGLDGFYGVFGKMVIGSATETDFTDSGVVTIFLDGFFEAGWSGVEINNANGSSVYSNTDHTFDSRGNTTTTDTRATYEVIACNAGDTETNPKFENFASIDLLTDFTMTTPTVNNCGAFTQNGGTITGGKVSNTTATAALVIDDDTEVTDVLLENNAIGIDATDAIVADEVTIVGCKFSGNTTDVTVNSANDIDIVMSGGADATTCTNTGAGTCTIVNGVTVKVNVKDFSDLSEIDGANVLVEAAPGGDLPSDDTVTITRSGTTATVTHTAHGLNTGDQIIIRGVAQPEYYGKHTITVTTVNAYTYTVTGSPTSPATGTIKATAHILSGITNSSGVVETLSFSFSGNQPVRGTVRKAT